MSARILSSLLLLLLAGLSGPVQAHRPSESALRLWLDADGDVELVWEVALADLVLEQDLDSDGDGLLRWMELRTQQSSLEAALPGWLAWKRGDADCATSSRPLQLVERFGETRLYWSMAMRCPGGGWPDAMRYAFLLGVDADHRLRLLTSSAAHVERLLTLEAAPQWQPLPLEDTGLWRTLGDYVLEGIWHIWIGLDHVLFLLALLLPCVLRFGPQGWQPVARLGPAIGSVVATVSAFTLAHSITLSAAVLGWVSAPVHWVEALIALSVALAALNNIWPVLRTRLWLLAFGFGLIHGFGFAFVLTELGLPSGLRGLALLGFNIGVEIGQLAIVLLVVPLAYWVRGHVLYRQWLRIGGSWAVAALALIWFVQRLS